ncbi:hypothetical protein AcW1_009409 [Taiwanofungus camphoratus]|nr:hypothetical protein AcW1_009409 [Antrodia cinnamomea]
MGISGLLPLLKDIQVNRPLSDFAGQTLAVDAYVWLHKGTYGCAPELATGRKTTKYVDYAMHRVRLLQHYRIQPYIVFDGGPLPAKKGTELERKKRRDENLARADGLAAQGRHGQAREYYVKCIDVTPQMAYQFIKALRAESVPYVVAPYEADAQLAYLERIGLVDGIITEDSDLLVFGCKNVLFKLDVTAGTITCISRADFASLTSMSSGGISLLGWSDVQFRSMAILSGCDYLPSIPGVGLKTAWSLLRKHKTVENVVRALNLEGKKKVPKGYLDAFRLAEKVFLYQRVYDPTQEKLVHLTELPHDEEWNDETEGYVGANLEPLLAKQVAEGDACPISLLPMEDINSTYVPRVLRTIPMHSKSLNCSGKNKGLVKRKASEKPTTDILSFFTPKSKTGNAPEGHSDNFTVKVSQDPTKSSMTAGKSSGKRTLAEVMDHDIAAKRKKRERASHEARPSKLTPSKFFCEASSSPLPRSNEDRSYEDPYSIAGPSRLANQAEGKENVPPPDDDDIFMEEPDPVTQEDGYISPSPSMTRWDTPELSSPLRSRAATKASGTKTDDDFGADVLSSPPLTRSRASMFTRGVFEHHSMPAGGNGVGRVFVRNSPAQSQHDQDALEPQEDLGPDLRNAFGDLDWDWDEVTSDIECPDVSQHSERSAASSPGLVTPDDSGEYGQGDVVICGEEEDAEEEAIDSRAIVARKEKVASGWWERWGRKTYGPDNDRNRGPLKRRETTMTPDGRQRRLQIRPHSARPASKRKGLQQDLRSAGRRSLVFMEEVITAPKAGLHNDTSCIRPGVVASEKGHNIVVNAKNKLAGFRWGG